MNVKLILEEVLQMSIWSHITNSTNVKRGDDYPDGFAYIDNPYSIKRQYIKTDGYVTFDPDNDYTLPGKLAFALDEYIKSNISHLAGLTVGSWASPYIIKDSMFVRDIDVLSTSKKMHMYAPADFYESMKRYFIDNGVPLSRNPFRCLGYDVYNTGEQKSSKPYRVIVGTEDAVSLYHNIILDENRAYYIYGTLVTDPQKLLCITCINEWKKGKV